MRVTRYLIVGGGMTAAAAVRGIRDIDPGGDITIVSAESDPPYKRPHLSKKLWHGGSIDKIWSAVDRTDVHLRMGRSIERVYPTSNLAMDDEGTPYRYDTLLLATGSSPRLLPFPSRRLIHFRTLSDYRRLRELADVADRFAVIGGGFVGSELAASLASIGKQVTMIFPGAGIGDRVFPEELTRWLNGYYTARGVRVIAGAMVTGIEDGDDATFVRFRESAGGAVRGIEVDGVVAGIGTHPNTELARAAGLPVGDGILADTWLNAGHPSIFTAGDVANVPVSALGGRRRIEHEDSARTMGRAAGRSMAGAREPYDHLPYFYSDLFDLGYEAVGDVDATLDTVVYWDEPFERGVISYRRRDRLAGVLLWNVWDRVEDARALIRAGEPVDRAAVQRLLLAPAALEAQ